MGRLPLAGRLPLVGDGARLAIPDTTGAIIGDSQAIVGTHLTNVGDHMAMLAPNYSGPGMEGQGEAGLEGDLVGTGKLHISFQQEQGNQMSGCIGQC